jgi:penicillin-binding protein 2
MSVIHTPREPDLDARHIVSLVVIGICLAAIFARLWILQVVKHDEYAERAQSYRLSSIPKLAPRGLIYDRTEKVEIAGLKPRIIITAKPRVVLRNKWVLSKLALMLGTPEEKLAKAVNDAAWRPYMATPIYLGATIHQATRIAEAGDALPGIGVDTQAVRFFPDSISYSHVLGYVWTPDQADVERLAADDLKPSDYVGKTGLEYTYERNLMGAPGSDAVEVDAKRRPVRVVGRESATPGQKLILSIDAKLQKKAIELMKGKRGAVVMLDPTNGEVLCMVSSPVYDVSVYEGGGNRRELQKLNTDKTTPLLNRAIGGQYSPGSTFKIVDSIAAAMEGRFSPYRTFYCPGFYKVGRGRTACLGRHGSITFATAFTRSCNTYFGSWADELGPDPLVAAARAVGLGSKTGLDMRSERSGFVPSPDWKAHRKRNPEPWYRGDSVNMGIGQGELRVTPLQMACVAALVGNEGVSYRPHFLRARVLPGPNGDRIDTVPEVLSKIDLDGAFWRSLKGAMVAVVQGQGGTARRAQIPGLVWGGKTGSTEHHAGRKTHGWFVGVAPMDNPKVAIAVLVEESGHGGEISAPIARELVKAYLMPSPATPAAVAHRANPASSSAAALSAARASSRRPSPR